MKINPYSTTSALTRFDRMKRSGIIIIIGIVVRITSLYPQNDTLVMYDVRSKTTADIANPYAGIGTTAGHTSWNFGSTEGIGILSVTAPPNPFPGAGFTDVSPARNFFSLTDFPVRCAVKIFRYTNGVLRQQCSGVMVSEDIVLTSSHCLYTYDDSGSVPYFQDSVLITPAYDNGSRHPGLPVSISARYIIPKSNIDYPFAQDVALVQVREPIGRVTGWIGISFSTGAVPLAGRVFHKFSYPGTVDPSDSTRVFNGDTLYYNYGTLDLINDWEVGYNINGIRGQSGSSLIFTDNEAYYSIGVQNWSAQSRHYRFGKEIFYALKHIIEGMTVPVQHFDAGTSSFAVSRAYPNPFNPATTIRYVLPSTGYVTLIVYDMLGRSVAALVGETQREGEYSVRFDGSGLPTGMYVYVLSAGNQRIAQKCMLIK